MFSYLKVLSLMQISVISGSENKYLFSLTANFFPLISLKPFSEVIQILFYYEVYSGKCPLFMQTIFPRQSYFLSRPNIFCYWILNVLQNQCVENLVSSMWYCWEVIDLLRVGPTGRSLGHWGHAPERDCRTPSPTLSSLLPGFVLPSTPSMRYCLTGSLKGMRPADHGLEPPK